jgi:peptidyl-dipeptidase Dcp
MPTTTLAADNPFAAASPLPYGAPAFDRIRDEHYAPAFTAGMRQHAAEVAAIAANPEPPTFVNTIEALERAGAMLSRVSKVFFNLTESTTNPTIQAVQADVAPRLAAHSDSIWLDAALFARVEAVFAARAQLADPEQRRLVERYHALFVRHGARLQPAAQQRLREINAAASTLTTTFQERLLAGTRALAVVVDTAAELDGLDASARSAAAAAAAAAGHTDKFLLTLQLPTSQGVLASLRDRRTRERVFQASIARGSRGDEHDTRKLIVELAALRAERARLLGFATHADYALQDQMAGTATAVTKLLTDMIPAIAAKAQAEAQELQAWLDVHQPGQRLAAHDWAWVAEQVRRERFALDDHEVRQYFELDTVLQHGLFAMAKALYGIALRERSDLPVYHADVRVFEVFDGDGSAIGLLYADLFARPNKRGGAWMDAFVDQSGLLGDRPVVVTVMNVPKAGAGEPTLLGFDEVTTLFHEFGHAVHGLFSRVQHPLLAGTAVPRDFVEFPSQFHEDFAFEPELLAACARHWRTGERLAADVVAKIRKARRFGQGFASLEYIAAAALDMAWHTLPPTPVVADVERFEADALAAAGVWSELVPPRYRSAYFAHIWPGGYGAGYYAYLWSEALAADAFAACGERGGMTAANGAHFRDCVLARGFTREPMAMFVAFRGRELDAGPLLTRRGLR